MFENLKELDKSLYFKYIDIEKNIKSYSQSIFSTMQSFCESYVKTAIHLCKQNVNIDKRDTLGTLLNKSLIKRILELEFNVLSLEEMNEINTLGNQYKHKEVYDINEEDVYKYYKYISDLIVKLLISKNLSYDLEVNKVYFNSLINSELDLDNQKNNVNDEEIKSINEKINILTKEHNLIKENLERINKKEKDKKNTKDQLEIIISDINKKELEINNIEKERKSIIEELRNADEKELVRLTKLKEIQTNRIIELELQKNELEIKKGEIEKLVFKDIENINKNKYEVLIEELRVEIEYLKMKLNDKKSTENLFIDKTMDYKAKSKALIKIRSTISSVSFNSNYVYDDNGFTIHGISGYNNSQIKYSNFYAVFFNLLNRGQIVKASSSIIDTFNEEFEYKIVYKLQIAILSMIREGILNNDIWDINIDKDYEQYLEIAIKDIFYWISKITKLANIKFDEPEYNINNKGKYNIKFETYNIDKNSIAIMNEYDNDLKCTVWIEEKINYLIDKTKHYDILIELLEYIFGFNEFKEGQIEIISNFLKNRNTIGVLPTGGGKSLTYYFSVLLQPKTSLIIAPINSLIKDQNDKLINLFGIDRIANMTGGNQFIENDIQRFRKGEILFSFASPERVQIKKFRDILVALSYEKTIGTIILDEVHCLSEWGHDFRIPYLMLSETLNHYCEGVNFLGLTATASRNVVEDLKIELSINNNNDVIFLEHLKRNNLNFKINCFNSVYSMKNGLINLLVDNYGNNTIYDISKKDEKTNAGLIFCKTKGGKNLGVESLHNILSYRFLDEVGKFHGDYKEEQDAFMNNEKSLLVSTKAFGMGVDKPNIRFTIHYGIPSSREGFYQEAGRAGRDNKNSDCLLFSYEHDKNIEKQVMEFLNLDTSISRLKELQKDLSWKSDLSTNFFFMVEDLETPEVEVKEAIQIYNELSEYVNKRKKYEIHASGQNKKRKEKYLYILHKIGVIHNWHVIYLNGANEVLLSIEENIRFADFDHIKNRTLAYMGAYNVNKKDLDKINNLNNIDNLPVLLLIVRKWYHDTFIKTRREHLANMYSFLNKHKFNSSSDAIQDELDQFFDLSEIIGTTEEGFNLSFENNNYEEVVNYAFEVDNDRLIKMQIQLERLLESVVNSKVDIFTGLINFRLNVFNQDRNGKQRFEYGLKQLDPNEFNEVIKGISNKYDTLDENQKLLLVNSISSIDNNSYLKLLKNHEKDYILNAIVCKKINERLNKYWR